MCNVIVDVKHLGISFQATQALKDVSFEIKEGKIFGFLGPSGAGKTTTIKLLTNQLKADKGDICIMGRAIQEFKEDLFQYIGVLSDNSGLYEKLSVHDNLKIFADLKNISDTTIKDILKKMGLMEHAKKKAGNLSKGMKQRLLFARAILHKPKILFLDEPTSALDPSTSEDVYALIYELKAQGTTIFLTTHNMAEADRLCDHVAFLHQGMICEMGTVDELKLKYAIDEVDVLTKSGKRMTCKRTKEDMIALLQTCEEDVVRIISKEPDLKTIFLNVTGRELS